MPDSPAPDQITHPPGRPLVKPASPPVGRKNNSCVTDTSLFVSPAPRSMRAALRVVHLAVHLPTPRAGRKNGSGPVAASQVAPPGVTRERSRLEKCQSPTSIRTGRAQYSFRGTRRPASSLRDVLSSYGVRTSARPASVAEAARCGGAAPVLAPGAVLQSPRRAALRHSVRGRRQAQRFCRVRALQSPPDADGGCHFDTCVRLPTIDNRTRPAVCSSRDARGCGSVEVLFRAPRTAPSGG